MMPNMRQATRGLGRRVTVQIIKQVVDDHEAVQKPVDVKRISIVIVPMPPKKIMIKPEGQRTWKWWMGTTTNKLATGSFLKIDKDPGKLYEVMEAEDWSQARVYHYHLAESPR